ncbi:unnamed protein product [Ambrosiozyma monospora]|uniref:Unnamed protein product n=1 Tax=Ambrosiozyma monospora TaxID=43982 RepID=A0ACB5SSD3_AMBMO|nr:unnamed protein product [Ambrosiozyma monospora]
MTRAHRHLITLVCLLCATICIASTVEDPLTTTTLSSSNAIEGDLFTVVPKTANLVTATFNSQKQQRQHLEARDTPIASSVSVAPSPSVTPHTNAKAMEWATVMVMESILQQPSLYILPGDNVNLTSVYGGYRNYSSAITYHPGYVFVLNSTEKAQLYGYYRDFYYLFNTAVLNLVSTLIDVKYSEFDSLTSTVTLASNSPTTLNLTTDTVHFDYFSMALGSAVYTDMELFFEKKYRAFLNTNNNTELMRTAYAAYTSVHNQQLAVDPRSIWSVFDEFMSVVPWGPQVRNAGYNWYRGLTGYEYRIGSVTMTPPKSGIDTGCYPVTDPYSPVNATTYFPAVFLRNYTNVFQNRSFGQGPWVTTTSEVATFRTMIHVSPMSTGKACNVVSQTATMTLNTKGIIQCGIIALAEDSMNNSAEFMKVIHSNDTNVQAYTSMIDYYQNVDIFGEQTKANRTNYNIVLANIYNFIFHLPTERKKQVLDYLGFCYIDQYMTIDPSQITSQTNSLITSTTSKQFVMTNYDTVKATFFSNLLSFGNLTNYIYFTTVTNGTRTSLLEKTGSGNQVAWVPTSFLGEGSVTDEVHTIGSVINIADVI